MGDAVKCTAPLPEYKQKCTITTLAALVYIRIYFCTIILSEGAALVSVEISNRVDK